MYARSMSSDSNAKHSAACMDHLDKLFTFCTTSKLACSASERSFAGFGWPRRASPGGPALRVGDRLRGVKVRLKSSFGDSAACSPHGCPCVLCHTSRCCMAACKCEQTGHVDLTPIDLQGQTSSNPHLGGWTQPHLLTDMLG